MFFIETKRFRPPYLEEQFAVQAIDKSEAKRKFIQYNENKRPREIIGVWEETNDVYQTQ